VTKKVVGVFVRFFVRRFKGPYHDNVLFRIGLATFYIGFLLNIFFCRWSFFALIVPFLFISFPKKLHRQPN
jgi:CPA2 family monovalent cation:H+ antiporter-2